MAANRKNPVNGWSAAIIQNRAQSFIRKAKGRLNSAQYSALVDTLAKYDSGCQCSSNLIDGTTEGEEILSQLQEILQSSHALIRSINDMIPESNHIGRVNIFNNFSDE